VAQSKSERLMNLVICLLVARGYVPKSRIRQVVSGYEEQSDEAFERMFERDKTELRELGIPIETGSYDPFGDEEPGYVISRTAFELPEIRLEPEEAAVVGLAARVWEHASLAEATSNAVLKLQAAGVDTDTRALSSVEPRVGVTEPAFWPLWEAVRDRRAVRFQYRKGNDTEPVDRLLQPWRVLSHFGRWYVIGHDAGRDAARMFRLSRIVGVPEPEGPREAFDTPEPEVLQQAAAALAPPEPAATARLRVRHGAGFGLRRRALTPAEPEQGAHAEWDLVEVSYGDAATMADEICGYAADVVVLEPPELRRLVVERLSAVAGVSQ